MAFPERFLEELVARNEITDVVKTYVNLSKRSGSNLFGLCPFHSEKTPSFSVSPDKQIYHCFGCGKGGGVISFIMEIENLSFPDAVHFLARRVNLEVPDDESDRQLRGRRERLLSLNREAARFFYDNLSRPQCRAVADYIAGRGISPASAKTFGLGAAPDSWSALCDEMQRRGYTKTELFDAGLAGKSSKTGNIYDFFRNRLMFPLIDVRGNVIGFSGRRITNDEKERKFVHTKETMLFNKSRFLFGLNLAKKTKLGRIILVEGNVDVITLRQAGFDNAVASLGTSLTEEQARLISNYTREVVIAYDSDKAGVAAAERAIDHLERLGVAIKVLKVPGNKDPDEYIRYNGAGAFAALLSGTGNHIEYRLSLIGDKYDLTNDQEKVAYLREVSEMLATVPSPVAREIYGNRVAELLKITPEGMQTEIKRALSRRSRERKRQLERETRPANIVQPKIRAMRYDSPVSAAAEEGVIRLLLGDPSLLRETGDLKKEDFTSEFLGKAYEYIKKRHEAHKPVSIAAMSADFTADEVSHLTLMMHKPASIAGAEKAMRDYIGVIRTEQLKKTEDLLEISRKYREIKGMEDKDV
ncbi:MAG: DNA primase [Clostridiales bacterium]|nr:DNA primase [Clostridiales bacterium]